MSNLPRVSIGLPVFNGERYLEETINSILNQTFTDFELVITDNASTDRTQEICLSYVNQDSRIHYHRNHKNLGAAPNYNLAFELASGEYFKWAAHDDLIAPDFLFRCVDALDQNPDVVLCYCKTTLIDGQGIPLHDYVPEPDTSVREPQKRFRNLLLTDTIWAGVLTFGLIRSGSIKQTAKIGSYPSSDEVFVAELTLHSHFYEIPEHLFFMRIHPEQSTQGNLTLERDRVLWFDTSMGGKIVLPKWQYLAGYLSAIYNAPISKKEQMFCYAQLVRWIFVQAHFRALG